MATAAVVVEPERRLGPMYRKWTADFKAFSAKKEEIIASLTQEALRCSRTAYLIGKNPEVVQECIDVVRKYQDAYLVVVCDRRYPVDDVDVIKRMMRLTLPGGEKVEVNFDHDSLENASMWRKKKRICKEMLFQRTYLMSLELFDLHEALEEMQNDAKRTFTVKEMEEFEAGNQEVAEVKELIGRLHDISIKNSILREILPQYRTYFNLQYLNISSPRTPTHLLPAFEGAVADIFGFIKSLSDLELEEWINEQLISIEDFLKGVARIIESYELMAEMLIKDPEEFLVEDSTMLRFNLQTLHPLDLSSDTLCKAEDIFDPGKIDQLRAKLSSEMQEYQSDRKKLRLISCAARLPELGWAHPKDHPLVLACKFCNNSCRDELDKWEVDIGGG